MISVCKNIEELVPLYIIVDGNVKWGVHWENSMAVPKRENVQFYVNEGG